MQSPVQDVQNLFLRLLSMAPDHTSRWVLHKNCGMLPVQADIYKACARLWNAMRVDPLLAKALESDVTLCLHGNSASWASKFLPRVVSLDGLQGIEARDLPTIPAPDLVSRPFRDGILSNALDAHYQRLWDVECEGSRYREDDPHSTNSAHRFQTYVFLDEGYHHLKLHASPHLLDTLFRFRVGAAGLHASLHCRDDALRKCTLCHMDAVEDERHVVQDCPAYASVRAHAAYDGLFRVLLQDGMKGFLNVEDQHTVACCLSQLLRLRRELLAQ